MLGASHHNMIQSDRTIAATAERAEVEAHAYNRVSENNPRAWLGRDATWRERRLFDWHYIAAEARRKEDFFGESYALERARAFEVT